MKLFRSFHFPVWLADHRQKFYINASISVYIRCYNDVACANTYIYTMNMCIARWHCSYIYSVFLGDIFSLSDERYPFLPLGEDVSCIKISATDVVTGTSKQVKQINTCIHTYMDIFSAYVLCICTYLCGCRIICVHILIFMCHYRPWMFAYIWFWSFGVEVNIQQENLGIKSCFHSNRSKLHCHWPFRWCSPCPQPQVRNYRSMQHIADYLRYL